MPTLSSLIVQRDVASMRTVEEAIARQVLHGGDLATNLLELSAVKEDALTWILAESHGLEPAPVGALPPPDTAALRRIPGELALRHGLFPLSLDDKVLVVATAEPLSAAVEEDLTFALGVAIRQLAAPLVRIRQAISVHYGIGLDRRFLRLIAKLEGRPDPSPSSMPPRLRGPGPMHLPRPASVPPPTFGTGIVGGPRRYTPPRQVLKTPVVAAPPGEAPVAVIPPIPAPPITLEGLTPLDAFDAAPGPPAPEPEVAAGPAAPEPPREPEARGAGSAATPAATRALAGWLRRAIKDERKGAPRGARRKGPFTASMVEEELEEAGTFDAVLDVFFDFAEQYFEYAVLFAVQGDLAEGRDAAGPGADRARVAGVGVPLDLPSTLALARERRAPVIARLSTEGIDADLRRDLRRVPADGERPGTVAVIPVVVRTRTVALLYGDDGTADVELSSLGDLIAVTAIVAGALERVILRKKLGNFRAADPSIPRARVVARYAKPAPAPDGAAALARALAGGQLVAGSAPHPPESPPSPPARAPQVSPGAESVRVPGVPPGAGGHAEISPSAMSARAPGPPPAAARAFGAEASPIPSMADSDPPPAAAPAAPSAGRFPDKSRPITEADLLDAGWGHLAGTSAPPPAAAPTPSPAGADRDLRGRRPPQERRGQAPEFPLRSKGAERPPSGPAGPPSPLPPEPGSLPPIAPPPPTAAANRPLAAKPIPRQDDDDAPAAPTASPATAAFVAAIEPSPAAAGRSQSATVRGIGNVAAQAHGVQPATQSQPAASGKALPSVIVDVDAEYASLVDRVVHAGPDSNLAFAELVKHGEQAMPTVIASFPGPLKVDRHRVRAELPAASQCGPILELVVAIRRAALPFVTVRSSSADADVRFWATHVLGELRYPEAASALTPRLFDDDVAVRRIARRSAAALVGAGAAGQPVVSGLDHLTRNTDEPIARRIMAIETMGEIRTGPLVPPLIAVLADPSDEVADAARRALLLITRQDLGRDARKWTDWWTKNSARHRIEWLIDALMHEVPSIRRAAGDELKQLTKEYFGYYDDLPKKERERAQGRYREWWEREGQAKFAR